MLQFLSVILIVKLAFMERYPDLPYITIISDANKWEINIYLNIPDCF